MTDLFCPRSVQSACERLVILSFDLCSFSPGLELENRPKGKKAAWEASGKSSGECTGKTTRESAWPILWGSPGGAPPFPVGTWRFIL
jgi:hypothetical protein